jgi:2-methylcitrate dehydratase PrpD
MDERYRTSLLDWLACAYGGRDEEAPAAARAVATNTPDRIAAAAAAGHVLDYDDTYLPGLAHLSAPVAPVACVLGAELSATIGDVMSAYAAGFEAMGAFTRAGHPALYERGWHPTAVCGVVGAATAACQLLGIDEEGRESALGLSLASASGLQGSFGSHAKSLQVGASAAAGVRAVNLAAAGARSSLERIATGFEGAYGAAWVRAASDDPPAIEENWIKAFPCCLQTHSSIEAAEEARAAGITPGAVDVIVHPVSRRAAPYDEVRDGLQAKFSIPYLVAFTLLHGPPGVRDFGEVDADAAALADQVTVTTDDSLLESEARLRAGDFETRIDAALGSPRHPMTTEQLEAKVRDLSGDALVGVLDDPREPAKLLVDAARLL